jgi:C-terminal processing protease CtpA/Prc
MKLNFRNKILYFFTFITIFLAILTTSSCRKDLPVVNAAQNYPGGSYPDLFEAFWNGMNSNYVFWGVDSTNWDKMYTTYKPLFAKLTTFDSASESTAENYFAAMTAGLIDSHYNLTFELTGNSFSPATYRRELMNPNYFTDSTFPSAVLDSLIPYKYIDASSLVMGTDTVSMEGSATPFTAVSGTINNSILYLYFSSFALSQAGANTSPVFNYFFNMVQNLPPYIRGIVIDLRGNGGGEVADLDFVVGQMIKTPVTFGYTRAKNGTGRLDYTPWAPAIVKPWYGGSANIKVPIVALADHLSASMAELTTMAIKTLPNGKFIGTRTWGANGPLAPQVYFNGGQFTIGTSTFGSTGYLFTYTSSTMFKYLNGSVYEGVGVPPDIYARETTAAYNSGEDLVVDAAINYINSQ